MPDDNVHSPGGSTFMCDITLWPPAILKVCCQTENLNRSIDAYLLGYIFEEQ